MSAYALPGLFLPLPLDGPKYGSGCDSFCRELPSAQLEQKESFEFETSRETEVRVKHGKIDAIQLLECLSGKRQAKSSCRRIRRRSATRCVVEKSNEPEHCSLLEGAMQFELSITCNGRTYGAVRSLARIRQLYRELMEEFEFYKKELPSDSCLRGVDGFNASSSSNRLIPILPDALEGTSASNFGLLNAIIHQYIPSLESWLNEVLDIIPPKDSPSLSYFLCETMLQTPPVVSRKPLTRGRSAPGRMECIVEEEKVEDE